MQYDYLDVTLVEQHCSIVWCEKTMRAAVIDPGGDLEMILNYIDLLDVRTEVILVTHGHTDHCGAAAALSRATGAPIKGPHRGDQPIIEQMSLTDRPHRLKGEAYVPEQWLEHGDTITFGEEVLEVLHCPGHTPGHVAYFSAAARQAFVGDILFRNAIGAWHHPNGNLEQLVTSIRTRLFPLGDDVVFLPGHGPMSTFGRERRENPFVGEIALERWRAGQENLSGGFTAGR